MSYDITVYEKPKTLVLGKIGEIKNEIESARSELQEAKDRSVTARNAYNNVPWYKPFTKQRLEKEYRKAMDDLSIANSKALIQQFKITGYVIALILLCFCIPMDGLQKMGQWVSSGFEERDAKFSSFVRKTIPLFKENKNRGKKNVLEGIFRIILILIVLFAVIFGIYKLITHKKDSPVVEEAASLVSDTPEENSVRVDDEKIDELQRKITELETTLSELTANQSHSEEIIEQDLLSENSVQNNFEDLLSEEIPEDAAEPLEEVQELSENANSLEPENLAPKQIEANAAKELEALDIENLYNEQD